MSRIHPVLAYAVNGAIGLSVAAGFLALPARNLTAQKQPAHCGGSSTESCCIIEKCSVGFEADGHTCTGSYSRRTWYYSSRA